MHCLILSTHFPHNIVDNFSWVSKSHLHSRQTKVSKFTSLIRFSLYCSAFLGLHENKVESRFVERFVERMKE